MKVYQYEKCESCKKAIRWLNEKKITFSSIPIREKSPTQKEILQMILSHGGNLKNYLTHRVKTTEIPKLKT